MPGSGGIPTPSPRLSPTPSPTLSEVRCGDAGYLLEAADHWSAAAASWEEACCGLADRIAGSGWAGAAAGAAFERAHRDRMAVVGLADELHAASAIARSGADRIGEARIAVLRAVDSAESAGFIVGEDFSVTCRGRFDPVHARVWAYAAELASNVATLIATDQQIAAELAAASAGLGDGLFATSGGPEQPGIPSPGSDPEMVRQWWDDRSPAGQQRLLAHHPEQIGNLRGLPCPVRDEANRTVMTRDIGRVEQAAADHHVTVDDVMGQPQRYGLSATDLTRYGNAVNCERGLEYNSRRTGKPTYLHSYDPEAFDGDGAAVIAINDPDRAAHIAVAVPGTGNSVAGGWLSRPDGSNLFTEMTAAAEGSGQMQCAMLYLGIDAPDSPLDPRIATATLARSGAVPLAADVNALRVTHTADVPHITVSGHSYGSTVVADAAAGFGMRSDDLILIGSPGTDLAGSAADLHLPEGGHVFVGSSSTDPVTRLGGLGPGNAPLGLGADPAANGFGSVRFKSEFPAWQFDHGHYYDPGSESLYSMADIATGNGAALESHGMTAPHRWSFPADTLPGFPSPAIDLEAIRLGTGGHYHARQR